MDLFSNRFGKRAVWYVLVVAAITAYERDTAEAQEDLRADLRLICDESGEGKLDMASFHLAVANALDVASERAVRAQLALCWSVALGAGGLL